MGFTFKTSNLWHSLSIPLQPVSTRSCHTSPISSIPTGLPMCTLILSPTAVCKVVSMNSKACRITTSCFSKAILKTCQFRIKAKTQGPQHGDLSPRLPAAPLPLHIATSQKSQWLHLSLLDLVTTFPERARQALSPKPLNWYHLFFPSGSALPLDIFLACPSPSSGH